MSNTLKGFSKVLLLVSLSCACQKEIAFEEKPSYEKIDVTLNAGMDSATPFSKVSMPTSGLSPEWDDLDSLAVFDGTEKNLFIVSENYGTSARFGGKITKGAATLQVLYPWSETASINANVVTAVLPAEQVVKSGENVAMGAMMAVARTSYDASTQSYGSLSFRNVFGLVKINVPEDGKIVSVVLKGMKSEKLAGEGTIDLSSDKPEFILSDNASSTITLRPEIGTFAKGDYYIAVAPVVLTEGFEVALVRADGGATAKSTTNPLNIERNKGWNLDDIVTEQIWKVYITTKEQLFAWADNYEMWQKTDIVELGADIDMENEAWTPHSFSGTFDGHDHKLYNYHVSCDGPCGLFHNLTGTVKNLVIGSKDGTT